MRFSYSIQSINRCEMIELAEDFSKEHFADAFRLQSFTSPPMEVRTENFPCSLTNVFAALHLDLEENNRNTF